MHAEHKTTRTQMQQAIEAGGTAASVFWRGSLQSLVEAWKHEGQFILTWEEAPDGAQFDESRYTKDERHVFATPEEVFRFLDERAVEVEAFDLLR